MANKTMTPSDKPITNRQISKLTDVIAAKLRKSGLPSDLSQDVVENSDAVTDIADKAIQSFKEKLHEADGIIVRSVYVDITRALQEVLDTISQSTYIRGDALESMPREYGGKKTVYFIPFDALSKKYIKSCDNKYLGDENQWKKARWIDNGDLKKALAELGFNSAGPNAVAAVNEADSSFAVKYPNITSWKKNGKCFAFYLDQHGVRVHDVSCSDKSWHRGWYFAAEKIPDGPL